MNQEKTVSKKIKAKHVIAGIAAGVLLVTSGVGAGYMLGVKENTSQENGQTGYAANPAYEYLVGSAAWQMSAEAHALMMQGFAVAEKILMKL